MITRQRIDSLAGRAATAMMSAACEHCGQSTAMPRAWPALAAGMIANGELELPAIDSDVWHADDDDGEPWQYIPSDAERAEWLAIHTAAFNRNLGKLVPACLACKRPLTRPSSMTTALMDDHELRRSIRILDPIYGFVTMPDGTLADSSEWMETFRAKGRIDCMAPRSAAAVAAVQRQRQQRQSI